MLDNDCFSTLIFIIGLDERVGGALLIFHFLVVDAVQEIIQASWKDLDIITAFQGGKHILKILGNKFSQFIV
jgi:hypothetical protein